MTEPAATTTPPTADDVAAIAAAGQKAAEGAAQGTTPEEMKVIVRDAIKAEAESRPAFTEDDAKQIAEASAAATIAQLQVHGAFEPQPEPVPTAAPGTPTPGTPEPTPAADETPQKKTLAERMLRG